MKYEIEFVRVDDAFDILEIEADDPQKAVNIAINETQLFDIRDSCDIVWAYEYVKKFDDWYHNTTYDVQFLCKQIIIWDENGKKLY